ncbi:MAG: YciI family protein [Mycobacteriales bacterium]|jgi:hypothetical protein
MKYVFLLYGDEAAEAAQPPEELRKILAEHGAISAEIRARGAMVAGEPLAASENATTIRFDTGEPVVTDGPFAETKEQIGGLYILECADLDEALEWGRRMPRSPGLVVEIRPVPEF